MAKLAGGKGIIAADAAILSEDCIVRRIFRGEIQGLLNRFGRCLGAEEFLSSGQPRFVDSHCHLCFRDSVVCRVRSLSFL
jgi:hypothetical protein